MLVRKLLENLLIDILRKRYGMQKCELFFDVSHGRFHGFNVLVKNINERIKDFKIIVPSLNHDFINELNKFRESGNSASHSLEIDVNEDDLMTEKDDLEQLIKTLVRIFNNI